MFTFVAPLYLLRDGVVYGVRVAFRKSPLNTSKDYEDDLLYEYALLFTGFIYALEWFLICFCDFLHAGSVKFTRNYFVSFIVIAVNQKTKCQMKHIRWSVPFSERNRYRCYLKETFGL